MAAERHRPDFISSIFRALLVVNILGFALAAIGMFCTVSARDAGVSGLLACSCLIASVGFLLLSRWQRLGLYVIAGIYALDSVILYIEYSYRLNSLFGEYGRYIPIAITGAVLLLLCILLFAVQDSKARKNCWAQMSDGADIKHFRHIYQLTSVVLLATGGTTFYLSKTMPHESSEMQPKEAAQPSRQISYEMLDSANVTFDEVIMIEPMLDSIPGDRQLKYHRRVFALKHMLLSGIMAKEHYPQDIINISKVHRDEFSESQQQILDWYLSLPEVDQQKWIDCPPVNNLGDFKQKLTEIIEK